WRHVRFDGRTDVTDAVARHHRRDALLEGRSRLLQKPRRFRGHLADGDGARGVSVVAALDHAVVQLQEVAFDELAPGGDAVDHLLVDGDADVLGKPVKTLERADTAAAD